MVRNGLHHQPEKVALTQERIYFCHTSHQESMRRHRKIACNWDFRNLQPTPLLNNRGHPDHALDWQQLAQGSKLSSFQTWRCSTLRQKNWTWVLIREVWSGRPSMAIMDSLGINQVVGSRLFIQRIWIRNFYLNILSRNLFFIHDSSCFREWVENT